MSLPHTLLGLLDRRPAHGYQLRELARGYSWIYPLSNANIYPALRKLEQSRWVEHHEEPHGGRVRKVYRVTEAGRSELQRWLSDANGSRLSYVDPALLRIAMLRGEAARSAPVWIEKEIAQMESDAAEMKDHIRGCAELSKYDRMVLERGRELASLRADWLRGLLDEIRNDLEGEGSLA